MKLSQRHQATFDEYYPGGYTIKKITMPDGSVIDEADFYHIMYIDIRAEGERTRDVPCVQKYSVDDWEKTKEVFEVHGIKVTGHSEYAIINDPIAKAREAKAKANVKPEAKPKGRPPQK